MKKLILKQTARHSPPLLTKNHTDIDFKNCDHLVILRQILFLVTVLYLLIFFQLKQSLNYQCFLGVQDVFTLPPLIRR